MSRSKTLRRLSLSGPRAVGSGRAVARAGTCSLHTAYERRDGIFSTTTQPPYSLLKVAGTRRRHTRSPSRSNVDRDVIWRVRRALERSQMILLDADFGKSGCMYGHPEFK
jgi:hypothetical protein